MVKPGDTISEQGWLMFTKNYNSETHQYEWGAFDFFRGKEPPSLGSNYLPFKPHTITAVIPDNWDPVTGEIKAIQAEIEQLKARTSQEIAQREQRIANLLALPAPAANPTEEENGHGF